MIVHLNGQLLPATEARISPFDRGFLFGDGVYEGLRSVVDSAGRSRIIGLGLHIKRMQAGLDEAGIVWDAAAIGPASLGLLKANGHDTGGDRPEAFVYWQVTRGTPPAGEPVRSRVPPATSAMRPTVFGYCTPQPALNTIVAPPTKRASLLRDIRWERGHLKSISLMGNIMLALEAGSAGMDEAVLFRRRGDSELVTEGLATNIIAVLPTLAGGAEIVTPLLRSVPILAGVTRSILLRHAPEIVERDVMVEELARAAELMFIGTTTLVSSIVSLDGRTIGDGTPGPIARRLLAVLVRAVSTGNDDW
ncbi:MAG: aminotransferase class IV [Phycisphaerales bacterium]|nr:aminotransferase class IV [Phycisphaerales bacterium]